MLYPYKQSPSEFINEHEGEFRFSLSVTGTLLKQCELWGTEVLEGFRQMAETKAVEFLEETYYHSLSSLLKNKSNSSKR